MQRGGFDDLRAFVAVGNERSFTKAAAKLGISQSALSQTVRQLELRLGVRLLTRTTRSVSLTDAGERLMRTVEPRFQEIEAELSAVGELREKPAGTIRITAGEHAIETILWPKLSTLLRQYPDIKVEFVTDYGLTDIVAERYDAGVRWGEQVGKDMIGLRIGPDASFAAIGSKGYFARHPVPLKPQDLVSHRCVNLRLAGSMRGNSKRAGARLRSGWTDNSFSAGSRKWSPRPAPASVLHMCQPMSWRTTLQRVA
jgi:DNA-binding transcriptional LysR family regulator